MEDVPFKEPVEVKIGRGHKVKTVFGAVDVLLNHWPDGGGSKHLAARRACHDVLVGLKKAHVARQAFRAAAQEADILDEADPVLTQRLKDSLRLK